MSFKFYPSAAHHPLYSGLSIWTRYAKNPNRIDILERSNSHVRLRTPDRDLLLTSDAHSFNSLRPMNENYDRVSHFSNFHAVNAATGVDSFMVNYPQHLPKIERSPRNRRPESLRRDGAEIMSDSGGYQILTEKVEFLDPVKVAGWYNENTDIGVSLDIPIPTVGDDRLLRSARVQAQNNHVMLQHLDPRVRLMNVLHGRTLEEYQRFRGVVERPDMGRDLCISDVYHGTIIQTLHDILGVVLTGHRYQQYHLLGVYNIPMMLPAIWAAAQLKRAGRLQCLSSDASTHIQSATVRMYHLQRAPDKPVERLILGINNPDSHISPYRTLPCACPVCRELKYTDVFSVLPGAVVTFLLLMHNQYEIVRYAKMMDDFAHNLSLEEYLSLAEGQMRQHPGRARDTSLNAIRMADVAAKSNDPMKDMQSKFAYFMKGSQNIYAGMQVNIHAVDAEADQPDDGSPLPTTPEYIQRFDAVLGRYEEYHKGTELEHGKSKTRKPGVPVKDGGSMFTKGHQRATGGGKPQKRVNPIKQPKQVTAAERAQRKIQRITREAPAFQKPGG